MNAKSSEKKPSIQTVLITLIPPFLLIGVFTYWVLNSSLPIVPAALCGLLALLISALMIRTSGTFLATIRTDAGSDEIFGIRRTRSNSSTLRHPILALILLAAFSRIIYFIAVYAVHTAYSGYGGGIFQMSALWNPPYSQGNSALNISNTWYAVPDFPNASYLPLFPLYPFLVSGLNLLTGNRFLAGLILSFLFFILSAVALYKLVLIDLGNSDAFRAVRYLCILPPSFLLNLPAADVLFLFLSIVTLIFARRRNYIAAAVSGAFTACTSLAGILLFVPLFFELMMDFRESRLLSVNAGQLAKAYIPKLISLLLIPAGTVFCVSLIQAKSGTAFPWFAVSPDLPNTGLTTVFQNFSSQIQTFLGMYASGSKEALQGYVVPNLICFITLPLFLLISVKRIRISYTVYGICYFLLTFGYGSLVSAPRYSILCVPFLIGMSVCFRKKALDFLFSLLSLILLAGYLFAFARQWGVF